MDCCYNYKVLIREELIIKIFKKTCGKGFYFKIKINKEKRK